MLDVWPEVYDKFWTDCLFEWNHGLGVRMSEICRECGNPSDGTEIYIRRKLWSYVEVDVEVVEYTVLR